MERTGDQWPLRDLSAISPSSPVLKFDELRLKHHEQDSWAFGDGLGNQGRLFSDPLHMDLVRKLGDTAFRNPERRHRWVHVFVNGLYHGVYDLSEEISDKWISDHDLASLPANASAATKALYAPERYLVYRPSGTNRPEAIALRSELNNLMFAAAQTTAPAIGSVAAIPIWEELERRLDMHNYVDSLIGITSAGRQIDNPAFIQQVLLQKIDSTTPPGYYWRARVTNWDHSFAFRQSWTYLPQVPPEVQDMMELQILVPLTRHVRFKAYFNARLHQAMLAAGPLTAEGFVPLVDIHRNALFPIVAADVARWLAQPSQGDPSLEAYGPKAWLEYGGLLRPTGTGSWFLNNRTAYLQSLANPASGHYTP